MPNIKSAIKRVRSDEKKTLANKMKRSQTRTMLRKAYRAIREGVKCRRLGERSHRNGRLAPHRVGFIATPLRAISRV